MMVADFPDQPRPGRVGRWLTELFNDWPDGSRPIAQGRGVGPEPIRQISDT
jgi:hypothetical protein